MTHAHTWLFEATNSKIQGICVYKYSTIYLTRSNIYAYPSPSTFFTRKGRIDHMYTLLSPNQFNTSL